MSVEILGKMDVYSTYMDIPFDIAAYCRGHKYSPEATNLARAIRSRQLADEAIKMAEKQHDDALKLISKSIERVREKMERTNGI